MDLNITDSIPIQILKLINNETKKKLTKNVILYKKKRHLIGLEKKPKHHSECIEPQRNQRKNLNLLQRKKYKTIVAKFHVNKLNCSDISME